MFKGIDLAFSFCLLSYSSLYVDLIKHIPFHFYAIEEKALMVTCFLSCYEDINWILQGVVVFVEVHQVDSHAC